MKNYSSRTNWLDLYLIIGAFMGAMWLTNQAPLSGAHHIIVDAGLLLLLFLLINRWINANKAGLIQEDRDKYAGRKLAEKRSELTPNQDTPRPLYRYAKRSSPVWLSAIAAFLSDFFRWL